MKSALAVDETPHALASYLPWPGAVPSAADRTRRIMAFAIGFGGMLYALAEIPELLTQYHCYPAWWIGVSAVVILAGDLALIWSSRHGQRVIRWSAAAAAMSYPVLMLMVAPALDYGAVTGSGMWIWRLTVVGAVAAPLALGRGWLLVLLPTWTAAEAAVNRFAIGSWTWASFGEDYIRVLAAQAAFVLFVSGACLAAQTLDVATVASRRLAVTTAAASAREQERTRIAALVHDSVLSTLLDASRAGADPQVLRRQAEGAIVQLSAMASPAQDGTYDAVGALELFGAAVWSVDWQLPYHEQIMAGGARLRVPAEVATTMAAALTEAVRNSVRHAPKGQPVRRTVVAAAGPDTLRLELTDDGPGFDPATVPAGRLGISVSILGRMRQLPGGSATVRSSPGSGTTVTLQWSATAESGGSP